MSVRDSGSVQPELPLEVLFAPYRPYHISVLRGEPGQVAKLLAEIADAVPDDAHLGAFSTSLVEAFLSRGETVFADFEIALGSSPNLGRAWSVAWSVVPDEWEARFDAAARVTDEIPPD